jgi:hypothetical protein
MRIFSILSLALILAGCSSNLKKGNNMMEAEQFDMAVQFYEKALQEDPGDTEIAIKLYESRSKMVSANLIKVRLQRQSNQFRGAAVTLNQSLYNIKRWKIIADSGVKTTIKEEVLEVGSWLNQQLIQIAEQKKYNRFFYTLKQFNYILDSGLADNAITKHKPAMNKMGMQQCQKMKQQLTPQSYYLYDVWVAYCGVFSSQGSYALSKDKTRYSRPDIASNRLKISKLAGILPKHIANDIQKGISNHPWFSPQASAPLRLNLAGQVNYSVKKKSVTFTHKYIVFKETLELIKDPKNNKVIRKLIHRKGYPKSVNYPGKEYVELSSHSVNVIGKVGTSPVTASHNLSKQKRITKSHNIVFKSERIYPLKPDFKNKQVWRKSISNGITKQIILNLDNAWIKQFCSDQNVDSRLTKSENTVRCSILKPNHGLVNAWAQSEFTLNYQELKILLTK